MPASTTASSVLPDLQRDDRRKHAIDFLVAAGQQHGRLLSDISLAPVDLNSNLPFLPLKRSRDEPVQPQPAKRARVISDLSDAPLPTFEFGPGQGLLPPPPVPPASSYEAALSLASLPMAQPLVGTSFLQPPFNYDLFRATAAAAPTGLEFGLDAARAPSTFDQLLPSSTAPPAKTAKTCGECKLEFADGAALTAHARVAHPNKPYPCLVCGRCFGEKGNMNKHHRTVHLKQRKHACATCGRSFAFMDGLNRHIAMVHLDRRPFECTFCQCPGGRHDDGVPCTHICGMRFKQKSHRRRHVRSVHQATR